MDPLKKMIITFSLIIIAIISLNVGGKMYKSMQQKKNTERLITYLKENGYTQLDDQNFYEKVEKGLSQEEYTDSEEIPRISDSYTYSNEFKNFIHQLSEITENNIETDYFFEFDFETKKINSYYSYTENDASSFIKGVYDVRDGKFTCTKATDSANKEKDGCSYLKNGSISFEKKVDDILSSSKTKLEYLK